MDSVWTRSGTTTCTTRCTRLLTGERQGYYVDFGSLAALAKVYTFAFLHDGTLLDLPGRCHGRPVDRAHTPGWPIRRSACRTTTRSAIGRSETGCRRSRRARLLEVGAVLLLTSPVHARCSGWARNGPPARRWPFFTSHPNRNSPTPTGRGRVEEFADHGWDTTRHDRSSGSARVPHRRAGLVGTGPPLRIGHACPLPPADRAAAAEPELQEAERLSDVAVDYDEAARWLVVHRGQLRIAANFGEVPQVVPGLRGAVVLATGEVTVTDGGLALDGLSAAVVRIG